MHPDAVRQLDREREFREAARAMMLTAKAENGKVTVDEWPAIRFLHCLPEIAQVPHVADDGSATWTTEPNAT